MIGGLKPQAEVSALMTAVEDLVKSLSKKPFATASQIIMKAAERLLEFSVKGTRFTLLGKGF